MTSKDYLVRPLVGVSRQISSLASLAIPPSGVSRVGRWTVWRAALVASALVVRRLRESELAATSGNLSNGSSRMSPTGLHPRLVGVFLGVSERIEATDTHVIQKVTKVIR